MDTDTTSKQLPNRPEAKLPPLPKGKLSSHPPVPPLSHTHTKLGFRIQKRPLQRRTPLSLGRVDIDGYASPSFLRPGGAIRTPTCIYVSAKAPFMSVVKKVRKALEGGNGQPRSTRGLPLTARVAALSTGGQSSGPAGDGGQNENAEPGGKEVVMLGTGRAIEKTLNVAAWFQKQQDCRVSLRTRSVAAVDDVVLGSDATNPEADPDDADGEMEDDDAANDVEDHTRVRMVSCLEVAVWLR